MFNEIENRGQDLPTAWPPWVPSNLNRTQPFELEAKVSISPSVEADPDAIAQVTDSVTDPSQSKERAIEPVPEIVQVRNASYLDPLQEWEGYVTDVSSDQFHAHLLDITAGSEIEEEFAEFPIDEVSDVDLELLKAGAIFRWIIGYERNKAGQKRRVSQLVFRRLPAWTRRDVAETKQLADSWADAIQRSDKVGSSNWPSNDGWGNIDGWTRAAG